MFYPLNYRGAWAGGGQSLANGRDMIQVFPAIAPGKWQAGRRGGPVVSRLVMRCRFRFHVDDHARMTRYGLAPGHGKVSKIP